MDRELARNVADLVENGFAPVWSREGGYPGEIPTDIAEWMSERGPDWHELIGPLSSLFWLAGFDDLVEAVYDPAIVMQDEVRVIPIKVGVIWILEHLYEEGLLPERLYIKYYFEDQPRSVRVIPVCIDPIPPAVGPSPAIHTLSDLFPMYRPQCLPRKVGTVRVKSRKSKERLASKIQNEYLSKLGGGSRLYRVSSRTALAALMAFFVPVIDKATLDNEFGPGLYTTSNLNWALEFAGVKNALLVFKNTDFRSLNVWTPELDDWQQLIATWTQKQLPNSADSISPSWRVSDVVSGSISNALSGNNCLPQPGEVTQVVAASYAACQALSSSLAMIIWLE